MRTRYLRKGARAAAISLVALCFAAPALAQQANDPPPADPFAGASNLGDAALASIATPQVLAQSIQTLTATNTGNSITAETIQNGDISIDADAFAGFSGIGNFVMNTGNNNNLQGSVSVVIVTPPPTP